MMEVTDSATRGILIEQTRYEGFCIDLIEEIAKLLNFKYEFELVPDGNYGTYNKETKQWNGLIRRLLDRVRSCLQLREIIFDVRSKLSKTEILSSSLLLISTFKY